MADSEEIAGSAKGEILLGNGIAVGGRKEHGKPLPCLGGVISLHENTIGLLRPSADTSAQLMELRQAEALRILDHHHRGVGDIDADLNHGGAHANVRLARGEGFHHRGLLLRAHAAVEYCDARIRKLFRKALRVVGDIFRVQAVALLDERADDVGLLSCCNVVRKEFVGLRPVRGIYHRRLYAKAVRGHLIKNRDVQIRIQHHRQGPGNRCCAHQKHMGRRALVRERAALLHTEAVLLIHNHGSEVFKGNALLEKRVGTNQNGNLSRFQLP